MIYLKGHSLEIWYNDPVTLGASFKPPPVLAGPCTQWIVWYKLDLFRVGWGLAWAPHLLFPATFSVPIHTHNKNQIRYKLGSVENWTLTHYECGSDEVTKAQRNGSNFKVQINYLKMSWKINGWDKIFGEIFTLHIRDKLCTSVGI